MASECPNLPMCGFFKKYCNSNKAACMGFVALYCRGEKQEACERKRYRREHNAPPPDEMMPNGTMLAV